MALGSWRSFFSILKCYCPQDHISEDQVHPELQPRGPRIAARGGWYSPALSSPAYYSNKREVANYSSRSSSQPHHSYYRQAQTSYNSSHKQQHQGGGTVQLQVEEQPAQEQLQGGGQVQALSSPPSSQNTWFESPDSIS